MSISDYTSSHIPTATPTLTSISPADGYYASSTTLDVIGSGFIPQAPKCLFGSTSYTGTYISATEMTCVAPAVAAPTIATVKVTFECIGTSAGSNFKYHGMFIYVDNTTIVK